MRRVPVMPGVDPARCARKRLSLNVGVCPLREDGSLDVPPVIGDASAGGRKGFR